VKEKKDDPSLARIPLPAGTPRYTERERKDRQEQFSKSINRLPADQQLTAWLVLSFIRGMAPSFAIHVHYCFRSYCNMVLIWWPGMIDMIELRLDPSSETVTQASLLLQRLLPIISSLPAQSETNTAATTAPTILDEVETFSRTLFKQLLPVALPPLPDAAPSTASSASATSGSSSATATTTTTTVATSDTSSSSASTTSSTSSTSDSSTSSSSNTSSESSSSSSSSSSDATTSSTSVSSSTSTSSSTTDEKSSLPASLSSTSLATRSSVSNSGSSTVPPAPTTSPPSSSSSTSSGVAPLQSLLSLAASTMVAQALSRSITQPP
jgi:hypothetical protein